LRQLSAGPWLFDGGLALVAAGVSTLFFIELLNVAQSALGRGTLALGYALVLLHTLPLAARRRFPGVVLASCVASGLAFVALGLPPVILGVAILVAVYSVAAYGEPVGLAGRPGRRGGRFGGRPAHPGQVRKPDACNQYPHPWRRVAAGPLRRCPPRLHRPAGAGRRAGAGPGGAGPPGGGRRTPAFGSGAA
jgi:hypothetical protein